MISWSSQRCNVVGPSGALQWMDAHLFQERQSGKLGMKGFAVHKGMFGAHRGIITEEVVTSQLRTYPQG